VAREGATGLNLYELRELGEIAQLCSVLIRRVDLR